MLTKIEMGVRAKTLSAEGKGSITLALALAGLAEKLLEATPELPLAR